MISTEVAVYNMALDAVGARNDVEITTEPSREAETCLLWYAAVRDQVLAAAHWPSARAFARLASLASAQDTWEDLDPEPGFSNSFSVPPDMLRPRNLVSFGRFTLTTRALAQLAINANEETPILVYTRRQVNIALWDSALQMAVVYGLAANIAKPITGKRSLAKDLIEQANALIIEAQVGAANSDDNFIEAIPDWLQARGCLNFSQTKFVYPHGTLLSVSSVN